MEFCQRKCPTKLPQHCHVLPGPSSPASLLGTWTAAQGWGLWGQGDPEPVQDTMRPLTLPAPWCQPR